ncbi:hypothetical protein Asppvi_001770 [Aspergillus pseudoviridinutans]|uniref:Uncharacterized protein n=1 Tax=Aspergillus pseudoviridinutans TaxID=1517512 RepID=A0A9P3BJJ0_9EURO|nr:uncharacterized protein Asppvi_001770 [Aspergillus pseudoviridinutans]GIJ92492.1 hypothetical protein Asppvi_001770 [Aspergillus pseudoviridinutans]
MFEHYLVESEGETGICNRGFDSTSTFLEIRSHSSIELLKSASTRLISTLIDLTSNIQKLRAQFFALTAPVMVPLCEFNASLGFPDNVDPQHGSPVIACYRRRLGKKTDLESRVAGLARGAQDASASARSATVTDGATITFSRLGGAHNHEYSALEHKVASGLWELAAKGEQGVQEAGDGDG